MQRYVQSECSELIQFLQEKLIDVKTPSGTNNMICLKGLGINSTYSTLSFTNCQADTYLFNLEIENTLSDKLLPNGQPNIYYLKDFDIVQQQYVVANWNFENDLDLNTHNVYFLTENTDYSAFGKNLIFDSLSQIHDGEPIIFKDYNNINVRSAILNTPENTQNQPSYIYFDDLSADGFSSEKTVSTEIRNFLYNKLGKTPNVTLAIWALLKEVKDAGENPLISDYNLNDNTRYYYRSSKNYFKAKLR